MLLIRTSMNNRIVEKLWKVIPHFKGVFIILQSSKNQISLIYNSYSQLENILRLHPFIKVNWEKVSLTRKFHLTENWTEMARLKWGLIWFSSSSTFRYHGQGCLKLEKALIPSVLHQDQKTIFNFYFNVC